jgi:hypothetical protein
VERLLENGVVGLLMERMFDTTSQVRRHVAAIHACTLRCLALRLGLIIAGLVCLRRSASMRRVP